MPDSALNTVKHNKKIDEKIASYPKQVKIKTICRISQNH